MKMMDTRAYVGMLKELVEQGREVRMVISDSWTRQYFLPSAGAGTSER